MLARGQAKISTAAPGKVLNRILQGAGDPLIAQT